MSYLRRPIAKGQVVPLHKNADYWLSCANRHMKKGENRQAAQLLRHAVMLEPEKYDLRAEYALALQTLNCYESSNREAFEVLASDPTQFQCYGIIGKNMMALGREQEAIDAFSHYIRFLRSAPDDVMISGELCDIEDMFDIEPVLRMARYETLLHISSARMSGGDALGAVKSLKRAEKLKLKDERVYTLLCVTLQQQGDVKAAMRYGRMALAQNPRSVQAHCALAGVLSQLGKRGASGALLMRAMRLCRYAGEEQLFCFTATGLGFLPLVTRMLSGNIKRLPGRLPTLYDLCVAYLKLGRLHDAAARIHLCHDLDPSDVPTRCLFATVKRFAAAGMTSVEVIKSARGIPYYPLLTAEDAQQKLSLLAGRLSEGLESFCLELQSDSDLYDTLLYALSLSGGGMGRLLAATAAALPRDTAEKLLRKVLVQCAPNEEVKRYAASCLMRMGAAQPYLVWNHGRIAHMRLSAPVPEKALAALLARLQKRFRDSALNTRALKIFLLMDEGLRAEVASDVETWESAIYHHHAGVRPENGRRRLLSAIETLEQLER